MVSVELSGVTKTYGPVRALAGVTVSFPSGKVTAVLGANGSGKSTLLTIVGTLSRPTSGRVLHGSLGATRQEVQRTLGWLGHDSLCYGDLSGRENIMLAATLHGLDAQEAFERAAERFELGSFVNRPFRNYSRGQRQRVALARALLHSPRLLLLDEPTTGLDASGVARLESIVKQEASSGAIVVLVTHDRGFAATVADRQVLIERGRIASSEFT